MGSPEAANVAELSVGGPVVVVTGPTGAGKTALAIEIAERFSGEIVNADSMQVYRFMDVGTAKPSLAERARVPHHLFDIVPPDVRYNAGRYVREARAVAAEIHARARLVVLCGGTGLYIRAFLDGLVVDAPADPDVRERLEREAALAVQEGEPARLHARLAALDPEAAERIHPRDLRRQIRALEIFERSGRPASEVRREHAFRDRPYRSLQLAVDPGRDELDRRIEQRCEAMMAAGLLREVRGLRGRGYGRELRSMQAIGYRHIQPVVDGLDTLANALEAMQRDTRRFARRQRTWLRGVEGVQWVDPRTPGDVYRAVQEFLTDRRAEQRLP